MGTPFRTELDFKDLKVTYEAVVSGEDHAYVFWHGFVATYVGGSSVRDDRFWEALDYIEAAVFTFERLLPGWWYSVGDCSVSAHASCGPDRAWEDAALLEDRLFDNGFHADLNNGVLSRRRTPAEALCVVMIEGLMARYCRAEYDAWQVERSAA
jgi:hypothetical protein